jgi:hypothetical protein
MSNTSAKTSSTTSNDLYTSKKSLDSTDSSTYQQYSSTIAAATTSKEPTGSIASSGYQSYKPSYQYDQNTPSQSQTKDSQPTKVSGQVDQFMYNALQDTNSALKAEVQRLTIFEQKCKQIEKEVSDFDDSFLFVKF